MNYWSEGLGDQELVMGLDRAKLSRKEDGIFLTGVVDAPAPWEYEVTVHFDDWAAVLRTATSKEASEFIVRSVPFKSVLRMGVSIARFVVLLTFYRFLRMIGLSSTPKIEKEAPRNAGSRDQLARKTH